MPQPHKSQVHVDAPLTNISIAYRQDAESFIADKVFPTVSVAKQSDKYFTYDRSDWLRSDTQRRAPGTESAGSGWNMSTDSYMAEVWAIHKDIDNQTRGNQDDPIDLDRDAVEFITQDMMIRKELEWQATAFTTSTWTGSLTAGDITPGNLWDTVAGTPISDVCEQAQSVAEKTGKMPNTFVAGPETFKELKEHPDVLDRIKYTQKGLVTKDILAGLFEVQNFYVPMATRNTAAESATATYDFIYGKNAALYYVESSPSPLKPSAGYTFSWSGLSGNSAGMAVSKFYIDALKSDRIELEAAWAQKVVAADLGVFFSSVVS